MGAMGRAVLGPLRRDYDLNLWSATGGGLPEEATPGDRLAGTPAEAAADAAMVVSFLRDDAASRAAWMSPNGALNTVSCDALCWEASTVSPGWAREWEGIGDGRGLAFCLGPVTGSTTRAAEGTLVCFLGGSAARRTQARAMLGALVSQFYDFDRAEDAAAYKLVHNSAAAAALVGLAEGLALAQRWGLDLELVRQVLTDFGWAGAVAGSRASNMLQDEDEPFMCSVLNIAKDLGYALALAEDLGLDLPQLRSCCQRFREAARDPRLGARDMSAVSRLYW